MERGKEETGRAIFGSYVRSCDKDKNAIMGSDCNIKEYVWRTFLTSSSPMNAFGLPFSWTGKRTLQTELQDLETTSYMESRH